MTNNVTCKLKKWKLPQPDQSIFSPTEATLSGLALFGQSSVALINERPEVPLVVDFEKRKELRLGSAKWAPILARHPNTQV